MLIRPPMIRTDASNPFAQHTMQVRVPATIRGISQLNPSYPASIHEALEQLASEIESDAVIPQLEAFAPDFLHWQAQYVAHAGHTWQHTDWFFAEIYTYRLIIQATRWWENMRDPFQPQKDEELANPALWELLDRALALRDVPMDERLYDLLHLDLWGNRIDLSFAASLAHGTHVGSEDLLVDNAEAAVKRVVSAAGRVHLITDNTGSELAMDLALVAALLENPTNTISLHVKMHPTFVSDATVRDVHLLIGQMKARGQAATKLADTLNGALDAGRLRLLPDFYWNSALPLWDIPAHLREGFTGASLVIIKGDANYRRVVGDAIWQLETPFAAVTADFPAPLLALRTLKSDPLVGLPVGLAEKLDGQDSRWHVNGKHGVIQFKP